MIQATFIRYVMKPTSAIDRKKDSPTNIEGHNQTSWFSNFSKKALDYLLVVPGLLFITPLLTIITILIKLESPGPLIYQYRVVGRNGRKFNAYKFRTMHINHAEIMAAYPQLTSQFKQNYNLKCDPRLTRIGYLLRKFGLDDLPQLFNILKQDMSLVGPRVVTQQELAKYGQYRNALLTVMPGLTGLWQINGNANLSFEDRVQMDMEYIRTWSISNDIKILLQTVPALIKGDRAY